jgi:flagellar protein FlbD
MGLLVIVVTRLNGGQFGVNPDLIQRIDSAPDTILTLIDGTKYIVAEPMPEVIALVHEYRASILARARVLADELDLAEAEEPPGTDDRPIAPAVPLRPRGV